MVYDGNQVALTYDIPMAEVGARLLRSPETTSRGYASLDYNFKRFQASDMVRVDVLINGERVDALALITHRETRKPRPRVGGEDEDLIPRQQFDIAIEAAIGTHIIALLTVESCVKTYWLMLWRRYQPRKLLQKQKGRNA